jgi:hypothetical protein
MKKILLALALLIGSALPAAAQGCGPQNPNCIVPTAPAGTSDNRAASTAFVQNAISPPGGAFAIASANAPVGGLPLYAAPTATGSGNCLSSGNACTLATACSFAKQIATFLGPAGPIQLADGSGGSYATATNGALCLIQGDSGGSSTQLISINGNAVAPTNVVLQVPSGAGGFIVQDFGLAGINNLEITAVNGAGPGIQGRQLAVCDYSGITWGTWGNSGAHVSVTGGASCNAGNETLLANGVEHWALSDGGHLNAVGTTTVPSAVAFSVGFIGVSASNVDLTGWITTGSGVSGTTGQNTFSGPGYLATAANASCASVVPGNNCSFSQGYQDSAGEGMTGTGIVVGQQAPTINNQIVTAHSYAGLPVSPTAGQISHIIDGLAANCGDGTCTTPGATVTGGGGSGGSAIDLLIGWDGAAWRIFRAQAVPRVVVNGTTCTIGSSCTITVTNAGVPQNNLNTQSGNYTIQTTDCGDTINATGAQSTITLPSVSGFATNCVLAVYNASGTRGQIVSGFPGAVAAAPTNILWPLDTITVQIVNGAWSIQSYPGRHKLTGSTTLFVDNTNGNDANDCLAATTSACKTRQGAFNYINTWDGNEKAITVSVAAGTYAANLTQNGPFHGNPTVTLQGDLTTPSNVLISTTSADGLDMLNGAALTMGGFKIVTTTGGDGVNVSNASFLNITGAMEYGAIAGNQIVAKSGSTITITANYTISGGANIHWLALQGAQILSSGSRTITLSGTPAFATAFASASTGGLVGSGATTFSGSATGPSFVTSTNAFVNNNTGSALPGSLSTSTVATHAYVTAPGAPGISSCGGSPGAASGTDFAGNVTEGTTATGCTITFSTGSTFKACNVSLSTGAAVGISTLGATLVVVHASLSNNVLYWTCAN